MTNQYDDAALLRAIETDSETLLELLWELTGRLGVGPVVARALASADALMQLLNAISSETLGLKRTKASLPEWGSRALPLEL